MERFPIEFDRRDGNRRGDSYPRVPVAGPARASGRPQDRRRSFPAVGEMAPPELPVSVLTVPVLLVAMVMLLEPFVIEIPVPGVRVAAAGAPAACRRRYSQPHRRG